MIPALMARSKMRQIIRLMEHEREILLNGPLTELPEISSRRAIILDAMENGGPVARSILGKGLGQIRDMALRNKKLFSASIAGMDAAQDTLKYIETNMGAMATYTSQGKKIVVTQKVAKKDRRI